MKKDIKLLIESIKDRQKKNNIRKKVTVILSCIVTLITIYFLMSPAITDSTNKTYILHLIDSYDTSINEQYSWKTITEGKYTQNFDLKLHFVDTDGNYIEGKDVTIDIDRKSVV